MATVQADGDHEVEQATEDLEPTQLADVLQGLTRELALANTLSRERERLIDRLHEENQTLRAGEFQQRLQPVWRDLIRLHDDLSRTAHNQDPQVRDLECFRDMVADILFRHCDLEPYSAVSGEPFQPAEHRAVRTVPVADPQMDRTIAGTVRQGFRTHDRVVRAAEVEVFRLEPKTESEEGA